jgi:hypothetical protein
MKNIILTSIVLLATLTSLAQNKNIKETTLTTTKTVNTPTGQKKYVKVENTKEVQKIELENPKPNTLNIPAKDSPILVTTTTTDINPDGSTRTVDVNRSSYFESNGSKYKLESDPSGYVLTDGNSSPSLLRKTSTNSYIFRSENKTAVGYFDTNGDLIVEIYDDKSDKITVQKYRALKE